MINAADLSRPSFDLSPAKPIDLILVRHDDIDNYLFDMHYELELGIVVKGKMKREYSNMTAELGPGDVWFCGMWEPHGFELIQTPCEVIVFVVDPAYLSKSGFLNRNASAPFQVSPQLRPKTSEAVREDVLNQAGIIYKKLEKYDDSDWIKLHFFQFLLQLLDGWSMPITDDQYFDNHQSIQPALRLVFDQKRLISTEEAASACNMSISSFRSTFKNLMNAPFSEFALQYRVRAAMAQLKKTNETQETVAYDWGFTDASHLLKNIGKLDL